MPIGSAEASGRAERLVGELACESSKEGYAAKPSKSEAVANPPVDSATSLSQHSMMQLDSIWDTDGEELGCIWEFIGEEPPGSAETRKDEVQTNNAVEDICTGSALPSHIVSGPPAVAERTKCESAVVADARCHSPAVAERTKCESAVVADARCQSPTVAETLLTGGSPAVAETSLAGGAALTPNPDQNLDLAEAVSSQSQTVVEMELRAKPISPQPQASPMLPLSTTGPLPQHQPQQQALPQQPPPLTGLAPPALKPSPPQPPSKPGATPTSRSPSPTPKQSPLKQPPPQPSPQSTGLAPPPLKATPPPPPTPSKLVATPEDSSPSPTPNQAPPQKQAPPSKPEPTLRSLKDPLHGEIPTSTHNVSPSNATPTPATVPSAPPLQESTQRRAWILDPSVSHAPVQSSDDKFRSAVATETRSAVATDTCQRESRPSARSQHSWCDEPVDSFNLQDDGTKRTLRNGNFGDQNFVGELAGDNCPARDKSSGNFALQLYNMGTRSDPNGANDNTRKQATRECMDNHLKRSAAQINVCLECNVAVEELLRAPGDSGADNPTWTPSKGVLLAHRPSWEHHVCVLGYDGRSNDTLMIAARISTFSLLEVLYDENMNEKAGNNTRILICKATLRKPVFIHGAEIIIFAVHGNRETMKKPGSTGYDRLYGTVQWAFKQFGPFFFLGDFNMGMLLVPHELSCRGLACDLLAYYPWTFSHGPFSEEKVGLDSCCIFYVGGDEVESRLSWPSSHIPRLLSAGRDDGTVTSDYGVELHSYRHHSHAPGQPWWNYRSKGETNLKTKLQDFLVCRKSQEEWKLERGSKHTKVRQLRFIQKQMPQDSVFVNGAFHNGAHMNLIVWTENPNRQSKNNKKTQRKMVERQSVERPSVEQRMVNQLLRSLVSCSDQL